MTSLEKHPISTPPRPPTAELWCMAHNLFFCLFIPVIQAVTLAGDNKWAVISVISPSTGTLLLKSHELVTRCSTPFLQSHVSGRAGETQPWAISNGAVRKDEHKHACFLLLLLERGSSKWGQRKILHFKVLKGVLQHFWQLVQICLLVKTIETEAENKLDAAFFVSTKCNQILLEEFRFLIRIQAHQAKMSLFQLLNHENLLFSSVF